MNRLMNPGGTAVGAIRARSELAARWRGPWDALSPDLDARVAASDWPEAESLVVLAWELVRFVPKASEAEREALLHVAFAALLAAQEGSTHIPLSTDDGRSWLEAVLSVTQPGPAARETIAALAHGRVPPGLDAVVGEEGYRPLLLSNGRLMVHRLAHFEGRLASSLAGNLGRPPLSISPEQVRAALSDLLAHTPAGRRPSCEQQLAVLNAIHLPLTVISGGPGTGKTTIVVALLRMLVRLGVAPARIALAAPTGKAAYRMGEALHAVLSSSAATPVDTALREQLPVPRTLHRLLGYSPSTDRFRHDEGNPLEHDVVIVDECSMIDLFLMDQLIRAASTRPGEVVPRRIVLLGDADQLPSVEAGAVFRDLMAPGPALERPWHALLQPAPGEQPPLTVPTHADVRSRAAVRLEHSFRMDERRPEGKAILECARAIHAGEPAALGPNGRAAPKERANASELEFRAVEFLEADLAEKAPEAFFRAWKRLCFARPEGESTARRFRIQSGEFVTEDVAGIREYIRQSQAQRILCLTRGHLPSGAETANAWFHDARRREPGSGPAHAGFLAGDPVIVLRNDYERGLFNGDQGLVVRCEEDGRTVLLAVFPRADRFVPFDLDALAGNLGLAYALTVHKAQGSEMQRAAVLLPAAASPLLVRELLYTAVSRASESVVIVGKREMLALAVKSPVRRWSALAERLSLLARGDSPGERII